MKNKKDNYSSDFINFGTFSAGEVDILKLELEKRGIPVKVIYPGTNVGTEIIARAGWTAYTVLIRGIDIKASLEICDYLNIKAGHEIPLPKLLYTKVNRYIIGTIFAILLVFIILESLGILQDGTSIIIISIFLPILFLMIIISHKIIRKNRE